MATADSPEGAPERTASPGKQPRTARGRETLRRLLDAAAQEFGERGFHEASISGITRRAGTALGSFYTYFDSKDAIFSALVRDMSQGVARAAAAGISPGATGTAREREALAAFLRLCPRAQGNLPHHRRMRIRRSRQLPDALRHHRARALWNGSRPGGVRGELDVEPSEVHAWAIMGMNVFLGLRFGVLDAKADLGEVAAQANALLKDGLG